MESWQEGIGQFKNSRAGCIKGLFSFIIFICLLYIKTRSNGSVVGTRAGNVHDLGSNPRSTLFLYYFAKHVPMQFQRWSAPYILQIRASTCPASTITRLRIEEHSGSQSTRSTLLKKVHKAMLKWAKLLDPYLLIWD